MSISLRALTRNCEPRRRRKSRFFETSSSSRKPKSSSSSSSSSSSKPLSLLALALSRSNFLLYGAPHCLKCRAAKTLIHALFKETSVDWRDHYVDVSKAKHCLHSVGIATVPTWEIDSRRFGGVFDAFGTSAQSGCHVGELVGWRALTKKHGSEKTAERMVVEARTTKATTTTRSSSKGTIDADYLAGASLGDVAAMSRAPGRRRTHRRTKRRSGWCKRLAVRLAMRGNGRFWCEFGELLSVMIKK